MSRYGSLRVPLGLTGVLGLIGVMGCGASLPAEANPEVAQRSLQTALAAWKGGEQAETLQALEPPIYFNDQQWSRGAALIDYAIEDQQRNGQGWNCGVSLILRKGQGQSKQQVRYQIDTDPHIVIVQQP